MWLVGWPRGLVPRRLSDSGVSSRCRREPCCAWGLCEPMAPPTTLCPPRPPLRCVPPAPPTTLCPPAPHYAVSPLPPTTLCPPAPPLCCVPPHPPLRCVPPPPPTMLCPSWEALRSTHRCWLPSRSPQASKWISTWNTEGREAASPPSLPAAPAPRRSAALSPAAALRTPANRMGTLRARRSLSPSR